MTVNKSNGRKIGIHASSIARPSKIYPNLEFWFENVPSGIPAFELNRKKRKFKIARHAGRQSGRPHTNTNTNNDTSISSIYHFFLLSAQFSYSFSAIHSVHSFFEKPFLSHYSRTKLRWM
jgi:hypothetical protein